VNAGKFYQPSGLAVAGISQQKTSSNEAGGFEPGE